MRKLLYRLLKRDDDSERIIFEMFYNKVYKTAFMITKDHHLAQDAVQETFAKAFNHLYRLKDPNKIGPWLGSIATNTAIDIVRKRNRWNDSPMEDVYIDSKLSNTHSNTIEWEIERVFLIKSVHNHISKLKDEYKQVIILRYLYDMKDHEIAETLGIKVGTVKSRLYRAKLKLREMIENSKDKEESVGDQR